MTSEKKIILGMSVLLIAESALLFFAWRRANRPPQERIEYIEKVITHTDTIKVVEPHEIVRERRITDTMWIPYIDTLRFTDTLFLPMPRESRVYADSTYKCEVSGIEPRLDWIEVYARTQVVEKWHKPSRWSFGLQVGYGLTLQEHPVFAPYAGIGITYRFAW